MDHMKNRALWIFAVCLVFLPSTFVLFVGCGTSSNNQEATQESTSAEPAPTDTTTDAGTEASVEPVVDAGEQTSDGGSTEAEPNTETTNTDGGTTEAPPEEQGCAPGEVYFVDRCMSASEFCPTRYSGSKDALAQPYEVVDGTFFCKTAKGYFYLPGSGYGACDQDKDGWTTIEGYRAMSYSEDSEENNKKIQENARCTILTIDAIVYTRDHYKDKTFVQKLPAPTPLLETSRNDGQGPSNEQPIYTSNQASLPTQSLNGGCDDTKPCSDGKLCYLGHCLEGQAIDPKHRNTLTKACLGGMDLNHNGVTDAKETPSTQVSPTEFNALLPYGYYIELYHGYYMTNYGDEKLKVYAITERPRSLELAQGGLPMYCSKTETTRSNYWTSCQLRDDQKCSTGTGHAAKGLSECWMPNVQRALPSLFKCVVFQDTDTNDYFHTDNYGSAKNNKNYHRPVCSLNGTVPYKINSTMAIQSLQFKCTSDGTYSRKPQGGQVGWACVNTKVYNKPADYQAGCIDECAESLDASGTQPCGNTYSADKCFLKADSYGQADFTCTEKQSSDCTVGRTTCSEGKAGTCKSLTIIKPDQVKDECNGKDDDCDGQTDEDFVTSQCYPTTKISGCVLRSDGKYVCRQPCMMGTTKCTKVGTEYKSQCVGYVLPSTEICDGKDNDCDGRIDNHPTNSSFDVGDSCTAGKGDCKRTGKIVCSSSKGWTCNATAATPPTNPLTQKPYSYEYKCGDLRDSDCNGYIDDYCIQRISGQFGQKGYGDINTNSKHMHPRGVAWAKLTFRIGSGVTYKDQEVLFVADGPNHIIRMLRLGNDGQRVLSRHTIAGQIGKAGSQDGPGLSASFHDPGAIVYSAKHQKLFVAARHKHVIRAIDLKPDSSGKYNFNVTTIAGQYAKLGNTSNTSGTNARFGWIFGMAISDDENSLFVADTSYHNIRKIDLANQSNPYYVTVVAGSTTGQWGNQTGTRGTDARFRNPRALAFHKVGTKRYLFVGQGRYSTIYRIDVDNNYKVDTLVSDSVYKKNCWNSYAEDGIQGFAAHAGMLYVTSYKGHRYCVFNASRTNTYVRGAGQAFKSGTGDMQASHINNPLWGAITFNSPWGITVRTSGSGSRIIYISEYNNHTIRAHIRPSSP